MTITNENRSRGFTIVELLIVIVVIAILATITIVAYNGIQGRARDAQRRQDIKVITQALEMYYLDNGTFPPSSCSSSCAMNTSWSTTADSSWQNLATYLVPKYISSLPKDPISKPGTNPQFADNYNYGYFADRNGAYCGPAGQTYIIVYNLESQSKEDTLIGNCSTTAPYSKLGPYAPASNYRVVKN